VTINDATDVLIEGGRFTGSAFDTSDHDGQPRARLRIRRNVFYDPDGYAIYGQMDTYLLEDNVLYYPRRPAYEGGNRHGMYLGRGGGKNATVRGNLVFMTQNQNTGNGIMLRPGGIMRGNVVVGAAWSGITMASCNDTDGKPPCTGSNGPVELDGNMVLDTPGTITGIGFGAKYREPKATVINNIVMRMQVPGITSSDGRYWTSGMTVDGDGVTLAGNVMVDAPLGGYLGADDIWKDNTILGTMGGILIFTDGMTSPTNFKASGNHYYPWVTGASTMSLERWLRVTNESNEATASFSLGKNGDSTQCTLGAYHDWLQGLPPADKKDPKIDNENRRFFEYAAAHHGKYSEDPRYAAGPAVLYMRSCLQKP
jgi:hypothetical protein